MRQGSGAGLGEAVADGEALGVGEGETVAESEGDGDGDGEGDGLARLHESSEETTTLSCWKARGKKSLQMANIDSCTSSGEVPETPIVTGGRHLLKHDHDAAVTEQ